MPIKFACEHCGQVLSVSSTKAGKGAKCPKCHQGITVPTAEAAAATLARRKQLTESAASATKSPSASAGKVVATAAVSPPPPPLKAAPSAPAISTPESATSASVAAASPPPPPTFSPPEVSNANDAHATAPPATADLVASASSEPDPFSQFVVYDDGAELVYAADEEDAYERDAEIDRDSLAVPRSVLYLQGALLGVVALVCFTLGVLVGGATMSGGTSNGPRVAKPCSISGSVVFRDRRKEASPDDGSVVIFLPQEARPDEKTPVLGLRPEDPTPDNDHAALTAIRNLGGGYARADSEGRYRVRVADTGSYFVLVISRNGKRKPGETFKTADLAQLGRYFADVTDLIGDNRYRWKVERISGDKTLSEEFN